MRMVVWATSCGSVIRRSSEVAAARAVFQGDYLRALRSVFVTREWGLTYGRFTGGTESVWGELSGIHKMIYCETR